MLGGAVTFAPMLIRFDGFELDEERLSLARDGVDVALRPKVFDLLVLLVRERHRVVRREELVERLWSRTVVGPGSLAGLVNELRGALAAAAGRRTRAIRTVHARGYQFVASVDSVGTAAPAAPADRADGVAAERPWRGAQDGAHESDASGRSNGSEVRRALLARLRGEVLGRGPRALVCALPGAEARGAWLAEVGRVALEVGFVVRSSVSTGAMPARGLVPTEEPLGPAPHEVRWRREADDAPGRVSGASLPREPVCCPLEVEDPAAWLAAGGLRRLLDLAGRAPVLVVAALATGPDDELMERIVAGDARVEGSEADRRGEDGIPVGVAPRSRRGLRPPDGDAEAFPGRSELAERLRDWAAVDRQSLEAVLRALGFVAEPTGPSRRMRRVGAGADREAQVAELGAG